MANRLWVVAGVVLAVVAAGVIASGILAGGAGGLDNFAPADFAFRTGQTVRSTLGSNQQPPAASVDSYLSGLTTFDADQMWNSFSGEYLAGMENRGGSKDLLQQNLDEAQRRGATYDEINYIGSFNLNNGYQYFFYVVSRRGFSGPDQQEQIYYVFTVDPQGKIVAVQ